MTKKHMFVTDPETGKSVEVKVDLKNIERQAREHRAAGRQVTVMSEDERIEAGLTAQWIAREHRQGRI